MVRKGCTTHRHHTHNFVARGCNVEKTSCWWSEKRRFNEEQAEEKFQAWVTEKQAKIDAKKSDLQKAKDAEAAKAFAAEKAANEARIAAAAPVVEEATEDTAEETTEASNEEE